VFLIQQVLLSSTRPLREYDSGGRLTKIKPANSDYPNSEMVYAYDDAGRSLSITNTANGDRTDFQYDEAGRKVGVQRFDPKTLERSRNCAYACSAWDAATSGAGIPLGGTIATIYDEGDRPIEMQTRDADGQILSRIVRTDNAAGLLIEDFVQFRAHRDLRGSHIGGHIVYFCHVPVGERTLAGR
jgi:YD repeat-containing protein